jgi:hypothetical protein
MKSALFVSSDTQENLKENGWRTIDSTDVNQSESLWEFLRFEVKGKRQLGPMARPHSAVVYSVLGQKHDDAALFAYAALAKACFM